MIIEGTALDANHVSFAGATLQVIGAPLTAGQSAAVAIRQHDIGLSTEAPASQANTIKAVVTRQVYLGAARDYMVQAAWIAKFVGGSPLSLTLAARVHKKAGLSGVDSIPRQNLLFFSIGEAEIQAALYWRYLDQIDDDLRPLAHPGLIVRRIDADVILQVLAEPCGLAVTDRVLRPQGSELQLPPGAPGLSRFRGRPVVSSCRFRPSARRCSVRGPRARASR